MVLSDMAVAELIWAGSLFIGSGGFYTISHYAERNFKKAAIEEEKVDGRTHEEWLSIVKDLGKEEYENLSRGPLDGLKENKLYGWDIKKLLGPALYESLMNEWYPEQARPAALTNEIRTASTGRMRKLTADGMYAIEYDKATNQVYSVKKVS